MSFALLAFAGWTDAVGFILFAGLYVSFMSGDATQLGVQLARGQVGPTAKFFGAQVLFVAGAAAGRVIAIRMQARRRRVLLATVAVLLAVAAGVGSAGWQVAAFVAAVLGMGMQNSVLHQAARVPVGTMVTGTLVRLGENIVDRLHGRPAPAWDNAGQWLGFIAGALGGALCYGALGAWAFAIPALAYAVVAVVAPPTADPGLT